MGKPMGRYSVTPEEKAATLRLAGWYEDDEQKWHRPTFTGAARVHRGVGVGISLEGAFQIWRDEP